MGKRNNGVGFLLSRKDRTALFEYKPVNSRFSGGKAGSITFYGFSSARYVTVLHIFKKIGRAVSKFATYNICYESVI